MWCKGGAGFGKTGIWGPEAGIVTDGRTDGLRFSWKLAVISHIDTNTVISTFRDIVGSIVDVKNFREIYAQ